VQEIAASHSAFPVGPIATPRPVHPPLCKISGSLETRLAEIFAPDYAARLDTARLRLLDSLGDVGASASPEV
jgi:hypothetical protein